MSASLPQGSPGSHPSKGVPGRTGTNGRHAAPGASAPSRAAPRVASVSLRVLAAASTATAAAAVLMAQAGPVHAEVATKPMPLPTAAPTKAKGPPSIVDAKGRRIIAMGDIHGDLMQCIRALRAAGLTDDTGGKWIGGDTILVQVGDILDRGDHELSILRMFRRLAKQAAKDGGAVYLVNGNHEIMNVAGDFRYVTPGAFQNFATQYEKSHNGEAARSADQARRELLKPGSEVARQLAKNSTVLQVGDTLFAHAGILPEHVEFGFDRLNERVSGWMEGRYPTPPRAVVEDTGVVWNRLYGAGPDQMYGAGGACPTLNKVLKSTDAKRMVIGHTPQEGGANAECKGKLWRIDVGQSRGIMGATPQVIEIKGDSVKVLVAPRVR